MTTILCRPLKGVIWPFHFIVWVCLYFFASLPSLAEENQATDKDEMLYSFSIEPQLLYNTVLNVIDTAGKQVVFQTSLTKGKLAPALKGNYSLQVALEHILFDSGLVIKKVGDVYILIAKSESVDDINHKTETHSAISKIVNDPHNPNDIDKIACCETVSHPAANQPLTEKDAPHVTTGKLLVEINKTAFKNQPLTKKGAEALNFNHSDIMRNEMNTSGGITTAAPPRVSSVVIIDEPDATQVAGSKSRALVNIRNEESILLTLDQKGKSALYAMYRKALKNTPTLSGKVTFELVIEPDGLVSACKILTSDLHNLDLESKLVNKLKLIDFGSNNVKSATVHWAINFMLPE